MKVISLVMTSLTMAAITAAHSAQPQEHEMTDARASAGQSSSFQHAMAQAMRRMEEGMAISHSGDPDRDFAAMMIPHHQGAIDMAKAELEFGHDPVLRRLAQGIIVEQQQEIQVMQRQLDALKARASAASPSPHSPHHRSNPTKE
jgi:uncharacterized protein (DUF305 family)